MCLRSFALPGVGCGAQRVYTTTTSPGLGKLWLMVCCCVTRARRTTPKRSVCAFLARCGVESRWIYVCAEYTRPAHVHRPTPPAPIFLSCALSPTPPAVTSFLLPDNGNRKRIYTPPSVPEQLHLLRCYPTPPLLSPWLPRLLVTPLPSSPMPLPWLAPPLPPVPPFSAAPPPPPPPPPPFSFFTAPLTRFVTLVITIVTKILPLLTVCDTSYN
jgi:hypothetical protein